MTNQKDRLLTPEELDLIHRQRMKEIMEQDKSLGLAEAMVLAVESEETKELELKTQDTKSVKAIMDELEEHISCDKWGNPTITVGVNNAGEREYFDWWQALKRGIDGTS